MKNNKLFKVVIFILIYTFIFSTVQFKEIKANPLATVPITSTLWTTAGLEAFATSVSMTGCAVVLPTYKFTDSITEEELQDFMTVYSPSTGKYYRPVDDIKLPTDPEVIDKYNKIGETKTADGYFNFYGVDFSDFIYNSVFDFIQTNCTASVPVQTGTYFVQSLPYEKTGNYYTWNVSPPDGVVSVFYPHLTTHNGYTDTFGIAFVSQSAFYFQVEKNMYKQNKPDFSSNLTEYVKSYYQSEVGLYCAVYQLDSSNYGIDSYSGFDYVYYSDFDGRSDSYAPCFNAIDYFNLFQDKSDFDIKDGSLADSIIKGITTTADQAWDLVKDYVLGADADVIENEKGEAIPITGVAVPGYNLEENEEEQKLLGTPYTGTGTARPLTGDKDNTGTAEGDETLDPTIEVDPSSELNILQGLWTWITGFFANLYNTLLKALKWLAVFLVGEGTLDFSKFQLSANKLVSVFPFCIPFDMVSLLALLNHSPVAPVFTWDFNKSFLGKYANFVITIDFSDYSQIITLIRFFVFITFAVGLLRITRDLIRG